MVGFFVFAGCLMKNKGGDGARELEAEGRASGRLITVQLDVTSDEQVATAVQAVRANLPSSIKVFNLVCFSHCGIRN